MRSVPREAFLPPAMVEFAYEDVPLPIVAGQTLPRAIDLEMEKDTAATHA